jgi:hypothetical protein
MPFFAGDAPVIISLVGEAATAKLKINHFLLGQSRS